MPRPTILPKEVYGMSTFAFLRFIGLAVVAALMVIGISLVFMEKASYAEGAGKETAANMLTAETTVNVPTAKTAVTTPTSDTSQKIAVPAAATTPTNSTAANMPTAVSVPVNDAVMGEKTKDAVILYLNSPVAYVNNSQTFVDETNPNASPFVENGRTLVPLRFIAEGFNAEVEWKSDIRTAEIKINDTLVTCKPDEKVLYADGKAIELDVPAKIMDDRIYVPLRAFAESIGKKVFYDNRLIVISNTDNIYDPVSDKATLNGIIAKLNNLPIIGTKEKFIELAGEVKEYGRWGYWEDDVLFDVALAPPLAAAGAQEQAVDSITGSDSGDLGAEAGSAPLEAPMAQIPQASSVPEGEAMVAGEAEKSADGDYSTTNIQVQGVDEADVIKTDGQYIYLLKNSKLYVVKAVPGDNMSIEFTVSFEDKEYRPQEIFVDGNTLVSIGTSSVRYGNDGDGEYYYGRYQERTTALIYDISDRQNVKQLREISVHGSYNSSRKVGSTVYLLSNLSSYDLIVNDDYIVPSYKDSAVQEDSIDIDYGDMRYFPGAKEAGRSSFTIIASFQIDNEDPARVYSYYGAGENIYATKDRLYVAMSSYNYRTLIDVIEVEDVSDNDIGFKESMPTPQPQQYSGPSTDVYKFSLDNGEVAYMYKGKVPGTIINQFSMDESEGYFRIATTSSNRGKQTNNLYVMDSKMDIVGRIENIAPNEKIYSTRFMGSRAYMVTFRTVDPLFVIDLSDPVNPKILGELKIPGYSDYLHPYDDTHLIGFGKDTIEHEGGAYYLGMKISMFDVSDVSNPKEMFTEIIGDRGTDSELLRNHKALLFSKEKNLLAFPVSVYKISSQAKPNPLNYGNFYSQGAFVYNVDLENGFVKKGEITHISEQPKERDYYYYGDQDLFIDRIIYIGNTLYTTSNSFVKSTSLSDMNDMGVLELK